MTTSNPTAQRYFSLGLRSLAARTDTREPAQAFRLAVEADPTMCDAWIGLMAVDRTQLSDPSAARGLLNSARNFGAELRRNGMVVDPAEGALGLKIPVQMGVVELGMPVTDVVYARAGAAVILAQTGHLAEAAEEFDWQHLDRYVIHQVSTVHTEQSCDRLGLDGAKVPRTFPTYGNMGPAAVPFTLALEAPHLERGDRVLLMGIGSGLNACCAEIEW